MFLCLMKTYGGSGCIAPQFLTSALDGGEWSASRPGRFTPGERAHGTHWIGGWVGPRAGLDAAEKIKFSPQPGFEPRPAAIPTACVHVEVINYAMRALLL
jgi:hypothetical protein